MLTTSIVVGAGFGAAAIAGALPFSGGDSATEHDSGGQGASALVTKAKAVQATRGRRGPRGPRGPRGRRGAAGGMQGPVFYYYEAQQKDAGRYYVKIECPAGWVALAGGVYSEKPEDDQVNASYPDPTDSRFWVVYLTLGNTGMVRSTAVCVTQTTNSTSAKPGTRGVEAIFRSLDSAGSP